MTDNLKCVCGNPECSSCGTAQGTSEESKPEQAGRDGFFGMVDRVQELFAILVNQELYDEDTYGNAVLELMGMLGQGETVTVLIYALIESHTKLKEWLFKEGVLKRQVCDCCDGGQHIKH